MSSDKNMTAGEYFGVSAMTLSSAALLEAIGGFGDIPALVAGVSVLGFFASLWEKNGFSQG